MSLCTRTPPAPEAPLAIPDKSVYVASNFAVQAISDSPRGELLPFDVQVSSVVVGKVET